MRPIAFSKLPKGEQKELLDDLNYLNGMEIKSYCNRHSIPFRIAIETRDGGRRTTKDVDRKGVMLKRIRHFLQTGVVLEQTCFPAAVVCFDPLPDKITQDDRLFYGHYDKKNRKLIALLKSLTNGQFENGAIARILAREFWSKGEAPTIERICVGVGRGLGTAHQAKPGVGVPVRQGEQVGSVRLEAIARK